MENVFLSIWFVKKDLFQGGQQEVTYEGDLVAICNLMLSCGSFGGHNQEMPFEDHAASQYNLYTKEETPGNDSELVRFRLHML